MATNDHKSKPTTTKIALTVAIAAWPAGLLVGLALKTGQDAPGEVYAIAIYQPSFEDQMYAIRVHNMTTQKMLDVSVNLAGLDHRIGRVDSLSKVEFAGSTRRPHGPVTITWIDPDYGPMEVSDQMAGGPPPRFDGGIVVVNVLSDRDIATYFLEADAQRRPD